MVEADFDARPAEDPPDLATPSTLVDLTIRDQTRPVAFDGEFLGFYPAMSGSGRRAGFHFEATLSRNDWGLTWNMALEAGGWLVGDEIRLEIDVAADETAAVVAGA